MYKMMLNVMFILINLAISSSFAQEVYFQNSQPSISQQKSSSGIVPTRAPSMSAADFRNSVSTINQNKQAAIAALAKQKQKDNAANTISKKPSTTMPTSRTGMDQSVTAPQTSIPQEQPAISTGPPQPTQTPPEQMTQPQTYTGFSGQGSSGSTPAKNQSAPDSKSGWGTGIQY